MRKRVLSLAGSIALAIAVIAVIVLVTRGSTMQNDMVLNRDEADMLAEARRGLLSLAPFDTYRTSTHLFLWPLFLSILARLGMPLTLQAAHVLSAVLLGWLALGAWWVMARTWGWRLAALFVLPGAMFYLSLKTPDARSLSTELLAMAIVMVAAVVAFTGKSVASGRRLMVAAFIAGMAVWAKPQIGPIALSLIVSALLLAHLAAHSPRVAWRQVGLAALAFVAPSVVFVLWILVSGTWSAFLDESFLMMFRYLDVHDPTVQQQPGLIARLPNVGATFVRLPGWLWALTGLTGWWLWQWRRSTVVVASLAWAAPLLAAFGTLFITYPIYDHYYGLVLVAGLLSAMVGSTAHLVVHGQSESPWRDAFPATLGYAFAGLMLFLTSLDGYSILIPGGPTIGVEESAPATSIARQCPPRSTVFVWGWAPELYSYYDWVPASRYVITNPLISHYATPDRMAATLESELRSSPPDCIVEDVGPGSWGNFGPGSGLRDIMPTLASSLAPCYRQGTATVRDQREVHYWQRLEDCGA